MATNLKKINFMSESRYNSLPTKNDDELYAVDIDNKFNSLESGINGLENSKANTSLNNLTTAGKEVATKASFPGSTKRTQLTFGATGTTYTAPADGYFYARLAGGGLATYLILYNQSSAMYSVDKANSARHECNVWIPAVKNEVVVLQYATQNNPTLQTIHFLYAEGES